MSKNMLEKLQVIVGSDHATTAEAERALHSQDQSSHTPCLPDAVVFPESTGQVSQILAFANEQRIPVVGWGAGSSLEGNPIPTQGGIVVDFRRMNQILEVHAGDFQATVQPGILYKDMNKTLARHGLFFAPDPGANASIGGIIANNAAGTRTVKYGATRDNIMALEVVLADGEIIRTGSRSIKQSAGYDLTHLIVGSEGTLGLVTEATLRLAPIPEHFSAVIVCFEDTTAAADAVFGIIGSGIVPAALELLDAATTRYYNMESQVQLPQQPTLLMEFHSASQTVLQADLDSVREICADCGSTRFEPGMGREERDRLWEGRHRLGEILFRAHPGHLYLITDVAVPISSYPVLASYSSDLMQEMQLLGALLGHAGDGNLHTIVFAPEDDPEQQDKLHQFNDQIVQKAISLNGTSTGEHGVGIGKQKYMVQEHGEAAVQTMRRIKLALDPNGILNPGKVLAL